MPRPEEYRPRNGQNYIIINGVPKEVSKVMTWVYALPVEEGKEPMVQIMVEGTPTDQGTRKLAEELLADLYARFPRIAQNAGG